MSYIIVTNPTSKPLPLKAGTCLDSITFETVRNMTHEGNYISHFHTDLDGSFVLCSCSKDECPVQKSVTSKGNDDMMNASSTQPAVQKTR